MRRSAPLKRRSSLKSGKPLKKKGPGKAKREKRTQAWRRSAAYKALRQAALERAGNRCEHRQYLGAAVIRDRAEMYYLRCPVVVTLDMHEKRYTKVRKDAQLDDVVILCRAHHMALESEIRPWNRGQLGRAS